ncbi:hypothetical protein Golax_019303, partial [Gossypium laxum]|nr:hypothetical protein [Gossypium laxum]
KNAPWLSVPQFGDWDQKGQVPDYSLDFSKIREMRKQNKREVSRASLGNEEEFINPTANTVSTTPSDDHHHNYPQNHHSPSANIPGIRHERKWGVEKCVAKTTIEGDVGDQFDLF